MKTMIRVERIKIEELRIPEVYRYMGFWQGEPEENIKSMVDSCLPDFMAAVGGKVCFSEEKLSLSYDGIRKPRIQMGNLVTFSDNLATHLKGCGRCILMAATAGPQADMLRNKALFQGGTMRQLVMDALGTEAVEWVADRFTERIKAYYPGYELISRFSPGYGDLPLELQKELTDYLDTKRKIGVGLSDSLLLTPSKSITAVIGIKRLPAAKDKQD